MNTSPIRTHWLFACCLSALLSSGLSSVDAQALTFDLPKSKYGLPVVNDIEIYGKIIAADPDNEFVDMRQIVPDAQFDVTYADTTNFLKRKLYPAPEVFMRKPAALAIRQAGENLKKQGFGLVLFDGYRPYAITVLFYEEHGDTTFVADPRKGSKHNRGMAIDLSLYDRKTGKRLSMPSGYDESTPRAYQSYMDSDSASLAHRTILRSAMEQVGFSIFPWEWWHYDFRGWGNVLHVRLILRSHPQSEQDVEEDEKIIGPPEAAHSDHTVSDWPRYKLPVVRVPRCWPEW